jgi:hypothetical protein
VKSDYEVFKEFVERISAKGFKVVERDYNGHTPPSPHEIGRSFEFISSEEQSAFEVEFLDGDFYRISGFTRGFWQDEIDWKKYD